MEISSSHQLYVFFLCVLLGMGCGLFFDIQRSIRKLGFAGRVRTTAEDVLFVFFCIAAAIALGFFFNNGQMRYYQVLGALSGALFYAAFLSGFIMRSLSKIYNFIKKVILKPFVKLVRLIITPFIKLYKIVKHRIKKLNKVLTRAIKGIKRSGKHIKKRMKML